MHLKPAHIEGRDFANINLSPPKTRPVHAKRRTYSIQMPGTYSIQTEGAVVVEISDDDPIVRAGPQNAGLLRRSKKSLVGRE